MRNAAAATTELGEDDREDAFSKESIGLPVADRSKNSSLHKSNLTSLAFYPSIKTREHRAPLANPLTP